MSSAKKYTIFLISSINLYFMFNPYTFWAELDRLAYLDYVFQEK